MAIVTSAAIDVLSIQEERVVTAGPNLPFYGTVQKATNHFRYNTNQDIWLNATQDQQIAALVQSTQAIDQLNFIGEKPEDQALEFPRDFQEGVMPVAIEKACYENALQLLNGVDPNTEIDNAMTSSRAYGGVRTTYDRTQLAPHYIHGIVSGIAWRYLQPFLNDGELLVMKRGS